MAPKTLSRFSLVRLNTAQLWADREVWRPRAHIKRKAHEADLELEGQFWLPDTDKASNDEGMEENSKADPVEAYLNDSGEEEQETDCEDDEVVSLE